MDGIVLKGTMTEIVDLLKTLKLVFHDVSIKDITRLRRLGILQEAEARQFEEMQNGQM